jgi:hypothetical protein
MRDALLSRYSPVSDTDGEVRKTYHDGVRPDHMMFASIEREKALAQEPIIRCPTCDQPAQELNDAKQRYTKPEGIDVAEPTLCYSLHPCGHAVTPEWAGNFTAEINRRVAGGSPRALQPHTQTVKKADDLEAALLGIVAERDVTAGEARRRLEYYLVITADELARLLPGARSRVPPVDALDPEVEAWADQNKMTKPPTKKTSEFGYPKGYRSPLAKSAGFLPAAGGAVEVMGAGPVSGPVSEASLFAKEQAMHTDPAAAAAGKEQLGRQRVARQIKNLGGMLARKTLAEVFSIDISPAQEECLQATSQIAEPTKLATGWEKDLVLAAQTFINQHTHLCLQIVSEQVLHQPMNDTRPAARELVDIKRNIAEHLTAGKPLSGEAAKLLNLVVPVFLPATGSVPTRPGPAPGMPLPVSAADIKDEFHDQFAPVRRRIVRRKGTDRPPGNS